MGLPLFDSNKYDMSELPIALIPVMTWKRTWGELACTSYADKLQELGDLCLVYAKQLDTQTMSTGVYGLSFIMRAYDDEKAQPIRCILVQDTKRTRKKLTVAIHQALKKQAARDAEERKRERIKKEKTVIKPRDKCLLKDPGGELSFVRIRLL